MTPEDQIKELNEIVRVRLAPSSIHGIGVFALRNIPKGERCFCIPTKAGLDQAGALKFYTLSYEQLDKLYKEVKELILDQWATVVNDSHFLNPNYTTWPILYMNHSYFPNFNQYTDKATRDIAAGEEIVEDYRLMDNWQKVFPWIQ